MFSFSQEDGVREGMRVLLVYEEVLQDDDIGEIIYHEFLEIGRARIDSVNDFGSRGTIENTPEGITLERGMPIITM